MIYKSIFILHDTFRYDFEYKKISELKRGWTVEYKGNLWSVIKIIQNDFIELRNLKNKKDKISIEITDNLISIVTKRESTRKYKTTIIERYRSIKNSELKKGTIVKYGKNLWKIIEIFSENEIQIQNKEKQTTKVKMTEIAIVHKQKLEYKKPDEKENTYKYKNYYETIYINRGTISGGAPSLGKR